MSALIAGAAGFDEAAFQRARAELDLHGLGPPRTMTCGSARLLWYPDHATDERDGCLELGDGFIACVGTLFHRGRTGRAALEALWRAFTEPTALGPDDPWGSYVLAISKGGQLWLFNDRLGMVKLYERADAGLFSTSWLTCVAAGERNAIDPIGSLDYVLAGASHGPRTPVAQVSTADPTLAIELTIGAKGTLSQPAEWFSHPMPSSRDAALDEAVDILASRSRAIADAFGPRIRCALSGGFDSRLLLASLRHVGAKPTLHVYGSAEDEDVRIARGIAERFRIPLHHIDKRSLERSAPELTAETLVAQMRFFDGVPTDGIFDRGTDRETRLAQSADSTIALNGGGGEVLRNFFYLRDGAFTVDQIVQTFYGNHDPRLARRAHDLDGYAAYLADSVAVQVGHGGRLTRGEVEAVYPLFRCRFWTSRNNTLAARCGAFLTPLLDPPLVRLALALPLAWKDYGRFEGQLIARLDPLLGDLPLSYGFTPRAGPDRAYAARMWLQHRRPPWLRARTVRLKRLAGRLAAPRIPEEAARLTAGERAIDDLVELAGLADISQVERALTLEQVIRRFGIR